MLAISMGAILNAFTDFEYFKKSGWENHLKSGIYLNSHRYMEVFSLAKYETFNNELIRN